MNLGSLEGVEGIERIIELIVRSTELSHEERWLEALACLDEGVAINSRLPICQLNRAQVLAALGRYEAALDDCDFFLDHATPLPDVLALRQQIFDEAMRCLERRLAQSPDDLAALFQRGRLFMKSRLYPQALADFSAVIARDPGNADALNDQGRVLFTQSRYAEAIAAHRQALARAPQNAFLWFNLGTVWRAQGHFDEARSAYRQAIVLDPELAEAHLEIAHCDLEQGDFSAGWPRFEWRWRTAQMRSLKLPSTAALWLGGQRVEGAAKADELAAKTLLVWAEQGAGDAVQFVRFVPQLLTVMGKVILRVSSPLRRLFACLDPRVEVVGDEQVLPFHDLHCPLMSLPLALGIAAPPPGAPYLRAGSGDIAVWRQRLGDSKALRIGLAWAGRQQGLRNQTRDVPLALLASLVAQGGDWISLQKEVAAGDAPEQAALPRLRSFAESLGDYADTAALIMNLDLVIAVDTSVAHLAGALGKPCWLLLRYSGEWRWLRECGDSPWYPSLTIFRQSAPGDWVELVARVSAALARRLEQGEGSPQ